MVSNAVSQILLAAAFLILLLARVRLQWPPLGLPLLLFALGTVIAVLLSPNPVAGIPQIKKFYVYLILIVLTTAFRGIGDVIRLMLLWAGLATASGLWSFVQFWHKRTEALSSSSDFYLYYVANRATGFLGHWMAFSAVQMVAGMMLASLLIFGAVRSHRAWLIGGLAVIAGSLAVAWTRSVWLAAAVGTIYLIAVWRPKMLLLSPLVMLTFWFIAPRSVRERVTSIYRPHGQIDSNSHRHVTFRTGTEMVRAHPWFGLGPEMPGREFSRYIPADIPRPLPSGFYGHLHNVYLQYAADRGIPTTLVFLWLVGKIVRDFATAVRRLAADERVRRAVLHGALAVILGLLAEAFFEHNLNDSEVLTMFLVVVASGYIATHPQEPVNA